MVTLVLPDEQREMDFAWYLSQLLKEPPSEQAIGMITEGFQLWAATWTHEKGTCACGCCERLREIFEREHDRVCRISTRHTREVSLITPEGVIKVLGERTYLPDWRDEALSVLKEVASNMRVAVPR